MVSRPPRVAGYPDADYLYRDPAQAESGGRKLEKGTAASN